MKSRITSSRSLIELIISLAVLALLVSYTYANFFVLPYFGFQYDPNGAIVDVFVESVVSQDLQIGDRLISIDGLSWEAIAQEPGATYFDDIQQGEVSEILVERNGVKQLIHWRMPGFSLQELRSRLLNIWLMSYVFWIAGSAALLMVRPHGQRRTLLVAMNYITAIWLMAGTLSNFHILGNFYILRIAVWMSLPIYLHLHWNIPRQFRPLPRIVWPILYSAAALGALLQSLLLFPSQFYIWAFLLALLGSALILATRFMLRPDERKEIAFIFIAVGVPFAPALAIALASTQESLSPSLPGFLFSLLSLPGGYFYVVYRRQLGNLEFRANRLISLYLFLVLLITALIALMPFFPQQLFSFSGSAGLVIAAVLLAVLITALSFNRFQRFIERRVLNMPLPPEHLLETYARKISTSITSKNLVHVLKQEVLPSLLVRQSALIQIEEETKPEVLFTIGLEKSQIPTPKEINDLLQQSKQAKSFAARLSTDPRISDWIRLHFPLVVGEQAQGLWLLGRRDPDDHFSQAEINILAALADQTAIALTNVSQAKRLRDLYQMDIDQQEIERAHLARELHDEVLNRMAELVILLGDEAYTAEFEQQYQQLVDYLRTTIHGLRPPMLSYGLHAALRELIEDVAHRDQNAFKIKFEVPSHDARYDPKVEQHLYRIIQQAVENALRHAEPKSITISGHIKDDEIDLLVSDDGRGFELQTGSDLVQLLASHHFGLAGMNERAALVGADLNIETAPGKGTRIRLFSRFEDSA